MSMWSDKDDNASKPKYVPFGQVRGVSVTDGGTGYDVADTVTFKAPAAGVTATGTLVLGTDGAVTGVQITNQGAGYVPADAVTATITTSTGSGAVLDVVLQPNLVPVSELVFVDIEEAQKELSRAKGIKTPGWNRVTTRVVDGEERRNVETMIALARKVADSGDSTDDAVVGDAEFSITTQPEAKTVATGSGTTFEVVVNPATGASYQWQVQTGGAGAYVNLTNVAPYTGATTATLTLSDVAGLDKNRYRVQVINQAGNAYITSKGAKLTVTS